MIASFLVLGICTAAAGYQLTALLACLRHLKGAEPANSGPLPPASILKPIRGADEGFRDAIRSHAALEYAPGFELLFGLYDPADPARSLIEELAREFPSVEIRIVDCPTVAPNAKVGTLHDLAASARYPVLVVNDSDISVPPDYLTRIATVLRDPAVGLVTCLYRASASTFAATVEALGIATDFAPSALVAPFVGVREFGLGSTLALRAETLQRIGGFARIQDFIADDYQLGKAVSSLGLRVVLSRVVVSTHLAGTWRAVWNHQVRWARTIRLSQAGYYGLPITNATFWALVAATTGHLFAGLALLGLRIITGIFAGILVLQDRVTTRYWWAIPLRDLFGLAVWLAGAGGRTAQWRGRILTLDREGRITASGR